MDPGHLAPVPPHHLGMIPGAINHPPGYVQVARQTRGLPDLDPARASYLHKNTRDFDYQITNDMYSGVPVPIKASLPGNTLISAAPVRTPTTPAAQPTTVPPTIAAGGKQKPKRSAEEMARAADEAAAVCADKNQKKAIETREKMLEKERAALRRESEAAAKTPQKTWPEDKSLELLRFWKCVKDKHT
ncbi:hypothetical protein PtB15_4B478 [Puccinia triticina]|nr:hypothetical protein PtB15_4B478 [Puccinia triticina]